MILVDYLGLALSVVLLGLSPGPGAFAIISKSLSDGFNKSLFIIFGIMFAHVIYVLITIYGLDYITKTFENIFLFIKYFGGLYLIFLAYKLWNKNIKFKETSTNINNTNKANFLTGCLIAFSNPKAIVFYVGFLPAFINLKTLTLDESIYILIIIPLSLGSVLTFYAFIAHKAKNIMENESSVVLLNRISSFMMFSVGLLLIF